MKSSQSFQLLIAIIAISISIVTTVAIAILYDTAFEQHRLHLLDSVKSQARLIEAVAQFDAQYNLDDSPDDWQAATLSQVINAHRKFEGFGKTGEFTMARKIGSQIIFVLSHRHSDLDTPEPVPFEGKWAEPMRLALSGQSGSIIGLDYRGIRVLAAYEPVQMLNVGLVAKLDLSEIRAPFLRAGIFTLVIAMIIILFASNLFIRITRPISREIEQQEEIFLTLTETAHEGIFMIDTHGIIQYINPAAQTLFGYDSNELKGENISKLMPSPHREQHDHYIQRYIKTGVKNIIGTKRQLTAIRKDGTRLPIFLSVGEVKLEHTHMFTGVIIDLTEQHQLSREILAVPIREQRRIGQELHDGLGQQLTGLSMVASSLLNKVTKPNFAQAEQLATGLQEAISQVRTLARGMMPVHVEADGFVIALRGLVQEISQQSQIPIKLQIESPTLISNNSTALHLFRITQEAINNAIKHADAQQITVTLKIERDRGLLEIADDGRGLPANIDNTTGIGLRIMKHRCGLFDGEIIFDPREGGGTQVHCRFPIDEQIEEPA